MPGHRWQATNGPYFAPSTAEDAEATAARVRQAAAGGVRKRALILPIVEAHDDQHLLGTVSRYAIDETGWTAMGIAIWDPAQWGRRLGTEALRLWIEILFRTEPDLHRLDLRTWSGNLGMCRVADRLGFTLEARFREARLVDGTRYDSVGFGLLRSEWARSAEPTS